MRNNTLRYFAAAIVVAAALPVMAGLSRPGPISKELKSTTIDSLTKQMKEVYFFEDLAAKVDKDLKARRDKGEYDSIESGEEFAKKLTADMNAICKDAHLNVRYSDEPLPVRKDDRQPSPDEIAEANEQMRTLNGGLERVERLPGNVGYVEVRAFMSKDAFQRPAQAAMSFLADSDALIIDLRRNGGGDPESVQYLCSYLFGEKVHLNDITMRGQGKQEFWTIDVPGKKLSDQPVYVLTSKRTGSGAEECAYDIQSLKRGTVIGESTWGGANPGDFIRLNDHFGAFIPTGQAMNPHTKKNWEGTGVIPDVAATPADALKIAHVSALKELIAKAKDARRKEWLESALKMVEDRPTK